MLWYIDDIIIWGATFDGTLERMRIVLDRIVAAGIKLKVKKSKILQRSVTFLSFRVSQEGVEPDPDRVKVILQWPEPRDSTETRAFIGVCAYYRKHIRDFAEIARPLYDSTKKRVLFKWGPAQNEALNALKRCLTTAPILACPLTEGE